MSEYAGSKTKLSTWRWFALPLFGLLSCHSAADDSADTITELLLYGAVADAARVVTLTTNGVGATGLLANQEASERYRFTGSAAGHLIVFYGAADGGATLDGILDLATGAGTAVTTVDRQIQGLVERREVILTAAEYLLTVRAFTGTAGSYTVAVAAGGVQGGGSCTIGANLCRDYNSGASDASARANCTAAGGAFSSAACTATNRVGRCTTGFFDSGATTVNGYSPGFANGTLYQADCLTSFGLDQFVFE
ncbi:MAG: hypothetical protein NXI24_07825 [bacterium]|nr:hypothetical protein [bacterium]